MRYFATLSMTTSGLSLAKKPNGFVILRETKNLMNKNK